jgi:hypothetical protein
MGKASQRLCASANVRRTGYILSIASLSPWLCRTICSATVDQLSCAISSGKKLPARRARHLKW